MTIEDSGKHKVHHITIRLSSSDLSLLNSINPVRAKAIRSLLDHYRCSQCSVPFEHFLLQLYSLLVEINSLLEESEKDTNNFDCKTSLYIRSRISDLLDIMFDNY